LWPLDFRAKAPRPEKSETLRLVFAGSIYRRLAMTRQPEPDTDQLLRGAEGGDDGARQALLTRHRARLRKMVALHLDHRLAARVDPSDVVQEALADAAARLSDYARRRPLPFYPWLRQLAWDRLIELHRRHVRAGRRSVVREDPDVLRLPDESAAKLAACLADLRSSPSGHVLREELRQRVRQTLGRLAAGDREVLVLRHLEQLSTADAAAVLGIGEGAFKSRHLRALQRLRALLRDDLAEGPP
jgi:RNA polymerase sigma-70 factor (ECF subfamily)